MIRADRIVVYTAKSCGYCDAAIRFLTEMKGESPEIVDLTGDQQARQDLSTRTGLRTVPQIWIGETHVGGFDDLRSLDRAGQLDRLIEAVRAARN